MWFIVQFRKRWVYHIIVDVASYYFVVCFVYLHVITVSQKVDYTAKVCIDVLTELLFVALFGIKNKKMKVPMCGCNQILILMN